MSWTLEQRAKIGKARDARALYPDDRDNQEAFIRDCVNQVQVDLHKR